MQTDPTLLSARPADRPFIERLLDGSDSPHANLDQVFESLYVFEVGGERLGVIGLAVRETAGLVRSAVIEPSCRGMGWGTEMCNCLLAEAHERDLTELYLLTTTASDFFATVGFVEIDRDTVPAAIRQTTEFTELCPGDAVCMARESAGDVPAGQGVA